MNEATNMKILAKETMIYGLSSIIGKFLNWLLVPLYTYVLAQQSDYGIVTNLYAWTALLLVILTYGMETGFFRFANREDTNPSQVYTTTLICIGFTSTLFAVLMCIFCHPVAAWLGYPTHSEFISLLSIVVAMDAFASIPFAYLRYRKRPIAFAILKLLFVFLNIAFNLFFLVLCPKIQDVAWIAAWYQPDYGVGYVFVANIISTALQTLILLPFARPEKNNDTPAASDAVALSGQSLNSVKTFFASLFTRGQRLGRFGFKREIECRSDRGTRGAAGYRETVGDGRGHRGTAIFERPIEASEQTNDAELPASYYTVTAMQETLARTNLNDLQVGDYVNLERAMSMDKLLDGHIVQGHVDQIATCIEARETEGSWYYRFEYESSPEMIRRGYFCVDKGSVAINGVSLTVCEPEVIGDKGYVSVCIIPYTHEVTNFKYIHVGTRVNIEFDIIGKYLARMNTLLNEN